MNPNSAHQTWSKWTFRVTPGRTVVRSFDQVKENCARFGRKAFGSVAQMRVTLLPLGYLVEVRAEGHPVHDPAYVDYMAAQWRRFFDSGFGAGTVVVCETKLEAGSRQDGSPSDQLIIVPPIAVQGA